jgi:4-amino-4-deoxy-L-arabinose transferase-like glycosyltransferase
MDQDKHTNFWIIISILVALKLIIHFATNTNYELHRDAFLYLAQSHHLAWGYVSIPPLTPFLARISQLFFSDSVFAVRLFPALIGAVSIILIGRIVMELGGRSWAVIIAGSTFLFSPAFLRSNTLLQPVSFNQFFWLFSSYYVLRLIKSKNPNYWFALGIIWGIAFLNKYSIVFLIVAFSIGILLTKFRKLFLTKQFLYSTGVGLLIILPNLIWQYNHDWPVISHMAELQRNQLVNVTIANFVIMQFLMNVNAIPVWLTGLLFVIVSKERAKYALFGWTFFLLMVILILLR